MLEVPSYDFRWYFAFEPHYHPISRGDYGIVNELSHSENL